MSIDKDKLVKMKSTIDSVRKLQGINSCVINVDVLEELICAYEAKPLPIGMPLDDARIFRIYEQSHVEVEENELVLNEFTDEDEYRKVKRHHFAPLKFADNLYYVIRNKLRGEES